MIETYVVTTNSSDPIAIEAIETSILHCSTVDSLNKVYTLDIGVDTNYCSTVLVSNGSAKIDGTHGRNACFAVAFRERTRKSDRP
jgi:hypothetical protein